MTVTLINSYFGKQGSFAHTEAPLGLGILASILEKNEIQVEIIDPFIQGLSKKDVINHLKRKDPEVIGLNCLTASRFDVIEMCERIGEELQETLVVVGGAHVSFLDKVWMEHTKTDVVCRFEAEKSFLNLCKGIPPEKIRGITYRRKNKIKENINEEWIKNLDELPFNSYHLFKGKYPKISNIKKEYQSLKHMGFVSSRGCNIGCNFCSSPKLFGSFWRGMSPKRTVDEIDYMVNNFGIEYIQMFDDHFTFNPQRAIQICKEIVRRNIDVMWWCESRVDVITDKLLYWMKKAGCHKINVGVESGSQRILDDVIGKRITIDQVKKSIRLCKKHSIDMTGFFIVGHPTETFEEYLKSCEIASEFEYIGVSGLEVYPGSDLHKDLNMPDEKWFEPHNPTYIYEGTFTKKQIDKMVAFLYDYHHVKNPDALFKEMGLKAIPYLVKNFGKYGFFRLTGGLL